MLDRSLPPVAQLWLNYITVDMMQDMTKKSESSYTGHIKYHRQYISYKVNQVPAINNHCKFHLDFDWWYCYPSGIQNNLTWLGTHNFFWIVILVKFKGGSVYWYEVMYYTNILHMP